MTILNALLFGSIAVLIALNLVLLAATVVWAVRGLLEKGHERRLARVWIPVRHRQPALSA